MIITVLQEIWSNSQVEYQSSSYQLRSLQARYNARSGAELNILRLYIYKNAKQMLGKHLNIARPYLDFVWSFPFLWPWPIASDFLESDKKELRSMTGNAFLRGSYSVHLFPEDGRLDINELSSPVPHLREFTSAMLLNLLLQHAEKNQEFKDKI